MNIPRHLMWIVMLLAMAWPMAWGADEIRITPVGSWPGYARGPGYAVAATATHAYLAAGLGGLIIVDIRDPANPRRVGGYDTSGRANGVTVAGNLAFVADGNAGLEVIDVSDPANPRRVGGYDTSGLGFGVAVAGNLAFVADGFAGLQVIDVSDPANPRRVGGYDTSGDAEGVAVAGNFAFVADGSADLQVIDVNDPANPRRVGGYDISGWAGGVAVAGNLAFVVDGAGLEMIDVSDPANPRRVGRYEYIGIPYGVAVAGNLAFVADGFAGLLVIDVSDPANPRRVGGYDTSGEPHGVAVAGNLAFVADGNAGLQMIDVSDAAKPRRVGGYDSSGEAHGVAVAGNLAFVADGLAGLRVIDVSDAANPRRVGGYDTSGLAYGVTVAGKLAFVADGFAGLQVIDVSDAANPRRVGGYDTSGDAYGVTVAGKLAFVADGVGLEVIDVSDPANPRRVGGYDTSRGANGVTVAGNLAFVAADAAGLQVIDVSDAANPRRVGGYDTGSRANGVAVAGNLAFVADGNAGLEVIDVSDPANPRRLGGYDTSGFAYGVTVAGKLAFVADWAGLEVIDVSDPANPPRVGGLNTPGAAHDVRVVGDHVFVADGEWGLQILRVQGGGPSSPAILNAPTHRSVPEGATTSLVVSASGTTPLAYQWWRDGYRIEGATQATLVLSNVTAANTGEYTVLVTNAVGAVLSPPAKLDVIAPPLIARSPEATTVLSGAALRLGFHATGSPPLSYRWLKDGTALIGSTSSNFVRTAATLADAGFYAVMVTNLAGSVTSTPVSVRVLEPLRIARGPAGIATAAGQRVTLSVQATGSGPYTYEWRINGQAIPIEHNSTARSATLEIAAASLADMGSYTVVVANEAEVVVSEPVEVTLTGLETVVPGDAFAGARGLLGGQGTLTTSAVGATREAGEPLHAGKPGGSSVWFQWTAPSSGIVRVDTIGSVFDTLLGVYTGDRVDGLTPVASDEDTGGYFTSVLSFNAVGGVTYRIAVDGLGGVAGRLVLSWDFRVAVPPAPEIVEQPVGLTRANGERGVELRVVAREATGYQWLRNEVELAGETQPTLLLDPYGVDKVGIYEVRVSGPGGVVTSRAASMELGADRTVRATDKLAELLALRGGEGGVALARPSARRLGPGGFASPAWVLYQGVATFGFDNRRATTSAEEPTAGYRINQGRIWFDLRVQERGALKVRAVGGSFPVILSLHPPTDWTRLLHHGTNSVLEVGLLEAGSYLLAVRGEDKGYIGLEVLLGQPPVRDDTVDTFEKALQGALVLTAPRVPPIPPPTYQWLREGHEIEGARRSTYEVPAGGGVEHRGQYAVVIDNGLGRVTNALWKVEVVVPPEVGEDESARWEGGRFKVGVRGTPGQRMVMMKTEDVLHFVAGEEFWMPMEGSGLYEDATASQRGWGFYRMLEKPLVPVWEGELKVGEKAMGGWRVEGGRLGQSYRVRIEGPGETNMLNGIVREQPWHLQAPTGAVVRILK